MLVFETERLCVQVATAEDATFFHALWSDPDVMTWVGFPKGLGLSLGQVHAILARQGEDDSPFEKRLVVILTATGERIGECKLGLPNADGISNTDVKLLPQFWGNKYGVEIKRRLLDYLFAHTDCLAVEATPNKSNEASIAMQEAVGGVRVGEGVFEPPESPHPERSSVPHYLYRVYRQNWKGTA